MKTLTFEFMLVDDGDPSSGIQPYEAKIIVNLEDNGADINPEMVEELRKHLADWFDCGCLHLKDYQDNIDQMKRYEYDMELETYCRMLEELNKANETRKRG